MTISDTFTGPMMGHQWTIKKTPPGPQWPQMGAKENAQTVYFKRFFAFFGVHKKCAFGAPKAPNVTKIKLLELQRPQTLQKSSFWSSGGLKPYKNQAFGAPEAPNVIKIKLLELQRPQTLQK